MIDRKYDITVEERGRQVFVIIKHCPFGCGKSINTGSWPRSFIMKALGDIQDKLDEHRSKCTQ